MAGILDEEIQRSAAMPEAPTQQGVLNPTDPGNVPGWNMSRWQGDAFLDNGLPRAFEGGYPTAAFIAANMGAPPQSFNPLGYSQFGQGPWQQPTGGGFFRDRNGGLYTDNSDLLGMGPGWIMRGGQLINAMTPQAQQGLPWNADPTFSDTAESGTANYPRRVAPGLGLMGVNKYDAYFWPGGNIFGHTRWPYQTDV